MHAVYNSLSIQSHFDKLYYFNATPRLSGHFSIRACNPLVNNQPRSQGSLLPPYGARERETLENAGHMHVSQSLGDYKQTIWGRGR